MLTAHDLPTASLQDIFNQSALHLLTQKEKVWITGRGCAYRLVNDEGKILKCAIGCFITDEEYDISIEGKLVQSMLNSLGIHNVNNERRYLLQILQEIHNNYPVESWCHKLEACAEQFSLKMVYPQPETIQELTDRVLPEKLTEG
jgi:hypothetical protein